ncbi:hypothetical protein [Endozoicomonas elysicola]|uniref:Uncharacterized protein n=1 Tax=Endozoicomonas elysicola TaxID=305900 RepID=A0A081K6T6_9GAMM|nr:hypothetical protein [Endozoicomonas elysicola]KEI69862.1 hypothetical protein GV64_03090 [Endozoicomonas elysicola]
MDSAGAAVRSIVDVAGQVLMAPFRFGCWLGRKVVSAVASLCNYLTGHSEIKSKNQTFQVPIDDRKVTTVDVSQVSTAPEQPVQPTSASSVQMVSGTSSLVKVDNVGVFIDAVSALNNASEFFRTALAFISTSVDNGPARKEIEASGQKPQDYWPLYLAPLEKRRSSIELVIHDLKNFALKVQGQDGHVPHSKFSVLRVQMDDLTQLIQDCKIKHCRFITEDENNCFIRAKAFIDDCKKALSMELNTPHSVRGY